MLVSMPVLLALGVALYLFARHCGMKIWHGVLGILVGAQISATALAPELNAAVTTADHLLRTVFS